MHRLVRTWRNLQSMAPCCTMYTCACMQPIVMHTCDCVAAVIDHWPCDSTSRLFSLVAGVFHCAERAINLWCGWRYSHHESKQRRASGLVSQAGFHLSRFSSTSLSMPPYQRQISASPLATWLASIDCIALGWKALNMSGAS